LKFRTVDQILDRLKRFFNNDNIGYRTFTRRQTETAPGFSQRMAGYKEESSRARHSRYTAKEVKEYLRGERAGERARPVFEQAARINTLLDERMRRNFAGRERLFDRLPYVLFQYTQGKPTFEIARSVSFFSDGDDVEDTMVFVSRLITKTINRHL
jgi:hypothetical protein